MHNLSNSIRRIRTLAMGAAILSILPLLAEGAGVMHVKWEGLSMVSLQTVRIFLPGGSITGTVVSVDADALVVDVKKTSDRNVPKGVLRVPRGKLHRLEMQTKGKLYRVLLTSLGTGLGSVGGLGAFYVIEDCHFVICNGNGNAGSAALLGLTAAGAVGGYLAGNAADKHWTAIEILP